MFDSAETQDQTPPLYPVTVQDQEPFRTRHPSPNFFHLWRTRLSRTQRISIITSLIVVLTIPLTVFAALNQTKTLSRAKEPIFLSSTPSAGTVNILQNHSFEIDSDGDRIPDLWEPGPDNDPGDQIYPHPFTGKYSFRFSPNPQVMIKKLLQPFTGGWSSGQRFYVSGWAIKKGSASINPAIIVYFRKPDNSGGEAWIIPINAKEGIWQKTYAYFDLFFKENGEKVLLQVNYPESYLYLDNIVLSTSPIPGLGNPIKAQFMQTNN